ncbi:hypothetical protein CHU92_03480, partial [Flavobacterium cyanobacteriorum]
MNYVPNETLTYNIIITNNGPDPEQVTVTNPLPGFTLNPGIIRFSWSSSTGLSGNNQALNSTVTINAGQTIIFTVTIRIPSGFNGNLPAPQVTWSEDTNIIVNNTNNQVSYTPGTTTVYTLSVTNAGPAIAQNVAVSNPVPAGITTFSWTGSNGTSGTGALADVLASLNVNQTVIYTITADIPAGFTGLLTSTPNVVINGPQTDPSPACNCTDTDYLVNTGADIVVVNTNNQAAYAPGAVTYTVTVTNNGPETAQNVVVTNPIPSGITAFSWTGSNGSSGTNTALNNTIPTLAVGQTITYTINLTVPTGYSALFLTSTASAVSSTTFDPDSSCPQCTDQDYRASSTADVVVTNTDGQVFYTNGQPNVYTVTVTNNGPNFATNIQVRNPVPAGIPASAMTWTGSNSSSGTGELVNNINSLAVGQTITYTVTIQVPVTFTGNLVNEVIATSYADPNPACTQCIDIDINDDPEANIVVTNTNGQDIFTPGGSSVYTLTVTNNGPAVAQNVVVSNPIPAGITSFTWSGSNGSSGTNTSLTDNIASLAAGQTITYTINLAVPAGYSATSVVSAASVTSTTLDPVPACPACTDIDYNQPSANIVVTQTLNSGTQFTPGNTAIYTVVITNEGPANAQNVNVQDVLPAGIAASSVTWSSSDGSAGTGALADIIPTLADGESVTYYIYVPVPSGYSPSQNLVHQINITSPTPDPDVSCPGCTNTATPNLKADLNIIKDNGQTTYVLGEPVMYTITVTNAGPSDAYNVLVTDPISLNVQNMTWYGNGAGGPGSMSNTINVLPAGQSVQYIVRFDVPETHPFDNLINTVTVTSNTPDPNPACPRCTDIDTPRGRFVTAAQNLYTNRELVEDVLIGAGCLVSNISWSTGPTADKNGIAYFHRNNSDFPVKEGVVLVCGSAVTPVGIAGPNPGAPGGVMSNNPGWAGDPDLIPFLQPDENITNDATSIQFTFTPLKDEISFNFLMASEEYSYNNFECNFSDVFAFILTDLTAASAPQNIALVPGTNTPVRVTSVHTATPGCAAAANPQWFGQYNWLPPGSPATIPKVNANVAPINFNGHTAKMEARADVVPGHQYRLKLVIANEGDNQLNSAIFLENGFDLGQARLPEDLSFANGTALCAGTVYDLSVQSQGVSYTFEWLRNGQPLLNNANQPITTPTIQITEPGRYTVIATTTATPVCEFRDDIIIDYTPPIGIQDPSGYQICANTSNSYTFDLTQKTNEILNGLDPFVYPLAYYATLADAEASFPALSDSEAANYTVTGPGTVYVRVDDITNGCYIIRPITIGIIDCNLQLPVPQPIHICEAAPYDDFEVFNLTIRNNAILGTLNPAEYTVTFHATQADAAGGINAVPSPVAYNSSDATVYVRVQNNSNPLIFGTTSLQLIVSPQPDIQQINDVEACGSYTLPPLVSGNYFTGPSGTGVPRFPNDVITASQTMYVYDIQGTAPYTCADEETFQITINAAPVVDEPANVTACSSYQLPSLAVGNYYTQPGGTGAQLSAGDIITTTQNIYVYAQSGTTTICTDESQFTVTIVIPPVLGTATPVEVCDDNTDGIASFNLSGAVSQILNGQTGLTATIHPTQASAETGTSALPFPQYSSATATIFVRVVATGSNCYSIAPVSLIVKPRPVIPSLTPISLCD